MRRKSSTAVERTVREVEDLGILPDPFDVDVFLNRLEQQRKRPIRLQETATRRKIPCGLWISTQTCDYIFHASTSSSLHRANIVLHEVGHILLNHRGDPGSALNITAISSTLAPHLDPKMIERMLGRSAYSAAEERDAEIFATLTLANRTVGHHGAHDLPPETAAVIRRVEGTWGRE